VRILSTLRGHARGGCEEEAGGAVAPCSLQHVCIDEDVLPGHICPVAGYVAHPSHISHKLIYNVDASRGDEAGRKVARASWRVWRFPKETTRMGGACNKHHLQSP
jgi:hypothetical protein